jgi:hypothetical protein
VAARISTYELLADRSLDVDDYALEGLERDVSSGFTRATTVIRLRGAGEEGIGEDVVYDTEDHVALQQAGAVPSLAGSWSLGEFSTSPRRAGARRRLAPLPPLGAT